MPFEIDYGSDATRSAGDWSYETFAEADQAFNAMMREHPEATCWLLEPGRGRVPFMLAQDHGDGRCPEMHWRYRDLGGKAGHPSEPDPYSEFPEGNPRKHRS